MVIDELQPAKLAYGLEELTRLLGLGRSTLYLEIRSGRLRLSKVGARSIVLTVDLMNYLEQIKKDQIVRQPEDRRRGTFLEASDR